MPHLAVPVGPNDHMQGAANAPVTMVEYGDYQCPDCGAAYPVVKALQTQLGGQLRFVFRNFPLRQIHPYAEGAAEAAEAMGAQGKFWEMHDMLFEHQDNLAQTYLVDYATELGADVPRFTHDLENGTFAGRVQQDVTSGERSGVPGTPTFFINGQMHEGNYDFASLMNAIDQALRSIPA